MDSQQVFGWFVQGSGAVIGFLCVIILREIRLSIDGTKKSLDDLSIKVAIVIEKTSSHEKQLDLHNGRLTDLEKK